MTDEIDNLFDRRARAIADDSGVPTLADVLRAADAPSATLAQMDKGVRWRRPTLAAVAFACAAAALLSFAREHMNNGPRATAEDPAIAPEPTATRLAASDQECEAHRTPAVSCAPENEDAESCDSQTEVSCDPSLSPAPAPSPPTP